ncbi:NAD-dependent protein deacetylase [soil metagenome]
MDDDLLCAADAIFLADALLIGAGAGMGVDSGLPDFRGREGFWKAYPPAARLRLSFAEMANPRWFLDDPAFAWGFYGHRLNLYRATLPHEGFAILRRWADRMPAGVFIFTSNVDGQFQRAGFVDDQIVECHGSLDWLQCHRSCGQTPFPADGVEVLVDEQTLRAAEPLPACPACGALARPNVLMFGDFDWEGDRTRAQYQRLESWLGSVRGASLVIVECGAGRAVPTVRLTCEQIARTGATLIRINPREPEVPDRQIGLPMGALEALQAIDRALPAG